ncbi:intradiol ring-cleavage dioxygenase [Burkholderia sp. Ac-20353]|uniref:intradiol ring-cleavage dioxygenase n=1 Tax=Burkholderia sp. Ac-20353 TaxID=2703894 RepID=UPI00197B140F|nr:intradiol ring-cleavage dioxygenase [Burkholderia sp. Ac-20353]MBN3785924.1 intradiol ring-cleavage dioxygenase [Burkholderia sp. Ac-20353]
MTTQSTTDDAVHGITDTVLATFSGCDDARLKTIMTALVRHLHDFAREVVLTPGEWRQGIEFLTAAGKMCDGIRQEFILLSDTLGLSILVDALHHRHDSGATDSSLLGPFYRDGAHDAAYGARIAHTEGETAVMHGRVLDTTGEPVAGALLEVWETANNGMYEGQDPGQPESNLRGRFRTRDDGSYAFVTIKPTPYPIPTDGPAGAMLMATGRHPMRPAHVHFLIAAPGYDMLTTALFAADDPYAGSDAVFGVKPSLVVDYVRNDSADAARAWGVDAPFFDVRRDFVLSAAHPATASERQG